METYAEARARLENLEALAELLAELSSTDRGIVEHRCQDLTGIYEDPTAVPLYLRPVRYPSHIDIRVIRAGGSD